MRSLIRQVQKQFVPIVILAIAIVGFTLFLRHLDSQSHQALPESNFPAFRYADLAKPATNLPVGDVLYIAMPNKFGGQMIFPLYVYKDDFVSSSQYVLEDMDPGFDITVDCTVLAYPKGSELFLVQPDTGIKVREYHETSGSFYLPTFAKNSRYLSVVHTWVVNDVIYRSIQVTDWASSSNGLTSLFTAGSSDGAFAPSNFRWFGREVAWIQATADDPYLYKAYASDITTKVTRPISLAEYQTFWATPQYDLEISRDAAIQKGCTPEKG